MLLWSFTVNVWKYVKTLPQTLATEELAVASWHRTVSHVLFQQGVFCQKQHDCHSPPILFAWLEVELQAMPNTLTEHNFQDEFKECQKYWEQWILMERDYFKGD
jgi:hypothetical protein